MNRKKLIAALIAALCVAFTMEGVGYYVGSRAVSGSTLMASGKTTEELRSRNRYLREGLRSMQPSGVYIVVDTADNVLFLKENGKILRKAVISSGSGNTLQKPGSGKEWVFDTPRGEFVVKTKFVNPVWTKPDWAFIEDGEKVPGRWQDRVEKGVLGQYALGLGDGYFIHGTLYTRLLGRNVTHGCVRMGDSDLKAVFEAAPVGTRVFIF